MLVTETRQCAQAVTRVRRARVMSAKRTGDALYSPDMLR
jgi:hypothetical protein